MKRSREYTCILVSLLAPLLLSAFRESSRLFLCNSLSANLNRTWGRVGTAHDKGLNSITFNSISMSEKRFKKKKKNSQLLDLLNVGDMGGLNEEKRHFISLHTS